MTWSGRGRGGDGDTGRRGYHHGNLREALIRAALDLIAAKGPAGFTFAEAARPQMKGARLIDRALELVIGGRTTVAEVLKIATQVEE